MRKKKSKLNYNYENKEMTVWYNSLKKTFNITAEIKAIQVKVENSSFLYSFLPVLPPQRFCYLSQVGVTSLFPFFISPLFLSNSIILFTTKVNIE